MTERRRPQRRAQSAIPTEIPDHEGLTPPPISIEDIDRLSDDTTPPPLKSQLRMLASGLEQVWSARNDAEQLNRIAIQQDHINRDLSEVSALLREFLMPAVKAAQGRIDLLIQHHEANKVRVELFYDREWPAAVKSLEGMTERLGRVERNLERYEIDMKGMGERFNTAHGALAQRIDTIASENTALALRVVSLETSSRDKSVASTAIAKRDKWWFAGISALVGFVAGIAPRVVEFFTK